MSWPTVALGDVVSFIGGSQPAKSNFIYEHKNGYVRLLQIRDYKSDKNLTYIPEDSTKKYCCKNDVMIGRYGPPVFQILRGLEGAYNVALMKAKPSELVDRDYLFYFLRQQDLFRLIDGLSQRTAGQSGVDMGALKNFPMLLPPLAEQQKIAAILDAADTLRQKDQQLIDHYTTLSQSLFLEMFGDPVGFKKRKFLDVFETNTGALDSNAANIVGKYPFFTCAKKALAIDSYSYDCEALLLAGNNAAGIFDVKYYKGKFNAYQRTYILQIKNSDVLYSYMKIALENRLVDLQRLSIGSSTQYLTMKILGRLVFNVPPIELQAEFAEFIQRIERQKQQAQESLEKSEALFNSLLQRAFKGELTSRQAA